MFGRLRQLLPAGRARASPSPASRPDIGPAVALLHAHRADDAVDLLRAAVSRAPDDSMAWLWLARALETGGRHDEALEAYAEAVDLVDGGPLAPLVQGEWARVRGDHAESAERLGMALDGDPGNPDLRHQLALVQEQLGRAVEAERVLLEGLVREPASQMLWNDLAALRLRTAGFAAAARCYEEAIAALPGDAVTRYNFAVACGQHGDAARAAALYREVMRLDPALSAARLNLGMTLYQTGDIAAASALFEERWDLSAGLRGAYLHPRERQWRGEPLEGRRLLLWAEQGLGDTLAMIRYAPLLKARGAGHVHGQVQASLLPLFEGMTGVDAWSALGTALDGTSHDLHCPMMSLPFCFGTRLDSIPADIPYLVADAVRARAWQERLPRRARRHRCGLVWSTGVWGDQAFAESRKLKSVPLASCTPLADFTDIEWVSLQMGPGREEIAAVGAFPLIDPTAGVRDFADTAAIITTLDLVVSVDTSVGHLASALGKPTVLLQKFEGGMFWLSGHEDSAWYPRVQRVARQARPGDWDSAVARAVAIVDNWRDCGDLWPPR